MAKRGSPYCIEKVMVSTFVAAFSVLFITYKYTSEQKFCHLSRIWVIYRGTVTVKFIWNFQSKEPTKQVLEETEGGNTSSKIGMGRPSV